MKMRIVFVAIAALSLNLGTAQPAPPVPPNWEPILTRPGALAKGSGHVQGFCVTSNAIYATLHDGLSPEAVIRHQRQHLGIEEGWDKVNVSGVKEACYYYSTYNAPDNTQPSNNPKKVMVLGGGPNRIGQGPVFGSMISGNSFSVSTTSPARSPHAAEITMSTFA